MAEPIKQSTLSRVVARRIVLFACAAAALQTVVTFAEYYFNDQQLASRMVEREATALLAGLSKSGDDFHFSLPAGLIRYSVDDPDYVTRIRTPKGQIIYSDCDQSCVEHLLPPQVHPPDVWSRLLRPGKPIAVAGGHVFDVDGATVFVEVVILNDHEGVMWRVLASEFAEHLIVPMSLMFFFLLSGALLTIRFALAPVERAALAAETIDPFDPTHRLVIERMPREIANLGAAVNRTLDRLHALMTAQRVFVTAVAHEVRTPLSMMKLELGHVNHPRARKVEKDIDDLARLVGQITTLGRLESADRAIFRPFDLAAAARKTVTDIAPWVYDQKGSLAFVESGAAIVNGHMPLIADAIRNLIENAVKHTPEGTRIEVAVGPGALLTVSDDRGLFRPAESNDKPGEYRGVGLEIVRRIMTIHRGRFETAVEPGMQTCMSLIFEKCASA